MDMPRNIATPLSLHWLGDRSNAELSQHAMDETGCVMYFATKQQCEEFMAWLTRQSVQHA